MLRSKPRECKGCGETRPLFARGLCTYCYNKERVLKSYREARIPPSEPVSPPSGLRVPPKPKKPSQPLKSRSARTTVTDTFLQEYFGFKSQVDLFDHLWETRAHKCPYSGLSLAPFKDDPDMRRSCCAHILPKGKYPLFKLNEENVMLVHPIFHSIVDGGTLRDREQYPEWRWDKWDTHVIQMKVEYRSFQSTNLL